MNGLLRVSGSALLLVALLCSACQSPRPVPTQAQRFPKATTTVDISRWIANPQAEPPVPASIISDVPSTPTAFLAGPKVELGLRDVLYTTLANNLDIYISDLDRDTARDRVTGAKGIYDLLARLSSSYGETLGGQRSASSSHGSSVSQTTSGGTNTGPTPGSSQSESKTRSLTLQHQALLDASLSQLLPSGAVISLAYDLTRQANLTNTVSRSFSAQTAQFGLLDSITSSQTDTINHSLNYVRSLTLGITQPLLRGFGPEVTNAPIHIARNNALLSREAFRAQVMAQLSRALKSYWDLVFAFNNLDVQKLSLAQAEDLLRINTVKFETGWRPKTDVLQAQAQVADRQEKVITAQKNVQDVMDVLKTTMNLPRDAQEWKAQLVPLQKPVFFETDYDETEAIEEAMAKRPEIRQAEIAQQNNEINRRVAKNDRLPELNVNALTGVVKPMSGEEYEADAYSIGMDFQYPLQNRQANARYQESLNQIEIGKASIDKSRQAVIQQVRTALRAIRTAREQIAVTKAAVEYETAKLEAEKERYDVGISTSFQVITFQNDFAAAEVNYLLSVIDYNKALIDFEVARGALLERFNIELREPGLTAPSTEEPLATEAQKAKISEADLTTAKPAFLGDMTEASRPVVSSALPPVGTPEPAATLPSGPSKAISPPSAAWSAAEPTAKVHLPAQRATPPSQPAPEGATQP
ncbi:MAG: TolC family protein [Candidatus Sumerlaeota bacterium]|nr:TolC family protein [Candidatus Sumerlaeota bacterium]